MRVEDSDSDNDDLLDRVIIDRQLAVSNSFTSTISRIGFYGRVTMHFKFRVMCETNFYGSDCTTFCEAQDSYTCGPNGQRVCSTGYSGVDCQTSKSFSYIQ